MKTITIALLVACGVVAQPSVRYCGGGVKESCVIQTDGAGNTPIPGNATVAGTFAVGATAARESPTLGAELIDGTGWTSTGWTGTYGAFVHTAGNTSSLSRAAAVVAGHYYRVRVDATAHTAGTVGVSLGGVTAVNSGGDILNPTSGTSVTVWAPKATTTDGVAVIPTSDFDGTVTAVSVKEITSPIAAHLVIIASDGTTAAYEVRGAPSISAGALVGQSLYVGTNAGTYTVGGGQNVGVGTGALQYNTSGYENAAVGYEAMKNNTTGAFSVAVGHKALTANLNGYDNTAVGDVSMYSNTSGHGNAAFGNQSLVSNTTGNFNTVVGDHALWSSQTGSNSVAIGSSALYWFTGTGGPNVAVGPNAMRAATSGFNNVAVGSDVLLALTTGRRNLGIGTSALQTQTSAWQNTAIGYAAGANNSNGQNNTYIGDSAGAAQTTGDSNTFLGSATDTDSGAGTYRTAVGFGAVAKIDHTITLGGAADATVIGSAAISTTGLVNGQCTFALASDTSFAIKCKGSDGTVRTGTVTLAP